MKGLSVEILELPGGNVSLELNARDMPKIWPRLERFGKVSREPGVLHDLVKVGRIGFIYYREWDEPCLISTSKAGAALLRELVAKPARSKAA